MNSEWPYKDIPKPPVFAGVPLVSVPEAVGTIGERLHPTAWEKPPTSWREKWWAVRSGGVLTEHIQEPPQELHAPDGELLGTVTGGRTVERREETEAAVPRLRDAFEAVGVLLATGAIRSVIAKPGQTNLAGTAAPLRVRRSEEVDAEAWVTLLRGESSPFEVDPCSRGPLQSLCWSSVLKLEQWTGCYVYVAASDVGPVSARALREAVDEAALEGTEHLPAHQVIGKMTRRLAAEGKLHNTRAVRDALSAEGKHRKVGDAAWVTVPDGKEVSVEDDAFRKAVGKALERSKPR